MKKILFGGKFKLMNFLIKKSIFLLLLLILINSTGFSQSIFSKQNLEQASLEELNSYLKESEKKKTTGTILSVAGPVTVLAGFAVFATSLEEDENSLLKYNYTTGSDIGGWMFVAGLVTTIIGVPMLIKGSSRVKRITEIMDSKSVSFEVAPCRFHNSFSPHDSPGIALRLKL